MKIKLILLSAAFLAFAGCKKDENKTCDLSSANLVGTYKVTSELVNGVETHNSSNYDPCELDDLIIFNADGTYDYSDAGTACSPSGDDSGTWSLSGSDLTVDGISEGTISNFSCSGFKVTSQVSTETIIVTLQRQ